MNRQSSRQSPAFLGLFFETTYTDNINIVIRFSSSFFLVTVGKANVFIYPSLKRLITCKNKQPHKCGFALPFNIFHVLCSLFSFSFVVLFDYKNFMKSQEPRASQRSMDSEKHRHLPQRTFNDFVFINFSNPGRNFKRIEREGDPKKVEKGFENTNEDLHTLGCEHYWRKDT